VYIYRLRRCLRPDDGAGNTVIASDAAGYRFVGRDVRRDVAEWEELLAAAAAAEQVGDLPGALDAYSRALALFQGEPLAGLPGPFAASQRLRLAERRTAVTLTKLELQIRLRDYANAIGELSSLAHLHPYHEPAAALLMRALHMSGRQADALAVYGCTRQRLVDDLGVEPGPELRRAHHCVLR
jgi:DNA-binding SARP family transcriptional activator